MKIKGSWILSTGAIILLILGAVLSEPTSIGREHYLIGDAIILAGLGYIAHKQEKVER